MRGLIIINLAVLIVMVIAAILLFEDRTLPLAALGVAALIAAFGGLTAYFYYERGKVYEERGEGGPDG